MIELKFVSAKESVWIIYENAIRDGTLPHGMTLQILETALPDCKFIGMFDQSEIIGVVSLNGCRIHWDIIPSRQAKWNSRQTIPRILDMCFQNTSILETSIDERNIRANKNAIQTGFVEVGQSEGYKHYKMTPDDRRL